MILPQPAVLGLRKSFGFGDRLGLATPGHLAAARQPVIPCANRKAAPLGPSPAPTTA